MSAPTGLAGPVYEGVDVGDAARVEAMIARAVRVAPQRELLEQEEHQQSDQQRREDGLRAGLRRNRLRQQLEQRDAEQRADRKAHQPRHPTLEHRERNQRGGKDREQAAGEICRDDRCKHHKVRR